MIFKLLIIAAKLLKEIFINTDKLVWFAESGTGCSVMEYLMFAPLADSA
jgi:hypothetical protein